MTLSRERMRQLSEGLMMLMDGPKVSPEMRKRAEDRLRYLKEAQRRCEKD